MKRVIGSVAGFLFVFILFFMHAQIVFGAYTANNLKQVCYAQKEKNSLDKTQEALLEGVCNYFVKGTVSAWLEGITEGAKDINGAEIVGGTCIPKSSTVPQWVSIVIKWLREHPEKLHKPATSIVIMAIKEAFPCKS